MTVVTSIIASKHIVRILVNTVDLILELTIVTVELSRGLSCENFIIFRPRT